MGSLWARVLGRYAPGEPAASARSALELIGHTLDGLKNVSIPEFISGGESMLSTLGAIRVALDEVDAASERAFSTGGSSQLSSTGITSGGSSQLS